MFTSDLDAINNLRTDAVNTIEPHYSGIRKLASYAAQLVWIGGKFPIDVSLGTAIRIDIYARNEINLLICFAVIDWRGVYLVPCSWL